METKRVEKAGAATISTEKSGVAFSVNRSAGPVVIELRLHHETISALKGVHIGFELLNGIGFEQAKKIVEALNENVIGLLVTSKSDSKTHVASV
jgi:hypothetical protein